MDFDRRGETLWFEWSGEGYQTMMPGAVVYATHGHVWLADSVVDRALDSAVQRDGIADTIGRALIAIQPFSLKHGYSGEVDGLQTHVCDENGETFYGDTVDETIPTTWVEVLP